MRRTARVHPERRRRTDDERRLVAYLRGLPIVARRAAETMPEPVAAKLSALSLDNLDRLLMRRSAVGEIRAERLRNRFASIVATSVRVDVQFRSMGRAVNAFTLPGEHEIVVLDGLLEACTDDEGIAVMGHELGHAVKRHVTRRMVAGLGATGLATLVVGDVSTVAATSVGVVGTLRFSRDEEREADALAVEYLQENGPSAEPLATFLEKLERESGEDQGPSSVLQTHPPTAERIAAIRALAKPAP